MSRKSQSYAVSVNEWEEWLAALERNVDELPQLEVPRQRLQTLVTQIRTFAADQAVHTAERQQATKRVDFLLVEGRKLATVIRTSVREHFGNRNEKLAEFGLQPLRGRPSRTTEENPLPQPE